MLGIDDTNEATATLKRLRDRVGARGLAFQYALMGVDDRVGTSMLHWPREDEDSPVDVSRFEMFLARPNQPYGADDLAAIDADADVVWATDPWQQRLRPFLKALGGFGSDAATAFASLVAAGCQPDFLAERVYRSELLPNETPDVRTARKLRAALKTKLEAAARSAEELRAFEMRCFEGSFPGEWMKQIRAMAADPGLAPREQRGANGMRFDITLPYAYLLRAADHVRDVTGVPRISDLLTIVNAIRNRLGRKALADNETMYKRLTRARRHAHDARATLTAEIEHDA